MKNQFFLLCFLKKRGGGWKIKRALFCSLATLSLQPHLVPDPQWHPTLSNPRAPSTTPSCPPKIDTQQLSLSLVIHCPARSEPMDEPLLSHSFPDCNHKLSGMWNRDGPLNNDGPLTITALDNLILPGSMQSDTVDVGM